MDEYFIKEIKNSIPNRLCDEIILMYELENIKYEGLTMGGVTKSIKDTTDMIIPVNDIKWKKIENFLYNELSTNLKIYFSRLNNINNENNNSIKNIKIFTKDAENLITNAFMIQKYDSGIGKYTYHDDFHVDHEMKKYRMVTFLWYLNDITEGGETEFFNGKIIIKPETGKLLLFPSSWLYPHRGKTPFLSDKYIITGWLYVGIGY